MNAPLADLAEDLARLAARARQLFAALDLGHDDRVLLREVHAGATHFAQQLEDLARRVRA